MERVEDRPGGRRRIDLDLYRDGKRAIRKDFAGVDE